jgi:hypothetical protein
MYTQTNTKLGNKNHSANNDLIGTILITMMH